MAVERKLDAMRSFIIQYPNWDKWGIESARGWFSNFTDISVDWFASPGDVAQLALQMTGSDIVRTSTDPVRQTYINGIKVRTRQMNFMLSVLQFSGSSGQRADTSEFLLDFIEWIDLMDEIESTPVFGDIPQEERTWATNGSFAAEWEGQRPASVYQIQIHKIYATEYPPIFK